MLFRNGINNVSDVSVIRVFFGQRETWQYKQDVSFYWFEIFSEIFIIDLSPVINPNISILRQHRWIVWSRRRLLIDQLHRNLLFHYQANSLVRHAKV